MYHFFSFQSKWSPCFAKKPSSVPLWCSPSGPTPPWMRPVTSFVRVVWLDQELFACFLSSGQLPEAGLTNWSGLFSSRQPDSFSAQRWVTTKTASGMFSSTLRGLKTQPVLIWLKSCGDLAACSGLANFCGEFSRCSRFCSGQCRCASSSRRWWSARRWLSSSMASRSAGSGS